MLFWTTKASLLEYITHSSPENGLYCPNPSSMDLNGVSGLLRELQARKAEVTEAAPVFVFVVSVA